MAGIEKVCEFSGDYPGYEMYRYKRNSIQVCPEYRKNFRNAKHVLVVQKAEKQEMDKYYGSSTFKESDLEYSKGTRWEVIYTTNRHDVPCLKNGKNYWKGKGFYRLRYKPTKPFSYFMDKLDIKQEYLYDLYCPELLGIVEGHYLNYSTDMNTVKRKLKRILRTKRVNIFYIEDSMNIENTAESLYKSIY